MARKIIYFVNIPEIVVISQTEPPVPTHRSITYALVDCPIPERGDRTALGICADCQHCVDIKERYVDCSYKQSTKERDEIDRRRKGITQVAPQPQPQPPLTVETKDPGMPRNVFTPKK